MRQIFFQSKDGLTQNVNEAENFTRLSEDMFVEKRKITKEIPPIILEQRLSFADGFLIGMVSSIVIAALVFILFH